MPLRRFSARWILACFWIICMSGVSGQFDANFTLQNMWSHLKSVKRSSIVCRSYENYMNITFSRLMDTGQGPDLPGFSQQFVEGKPLFARILFMQARDRLNRFGVYQCRIVLNSIATEIVTFKLPPPSQAELEAASPYVMANVGDDVELEVNVTKRLELPVKWMHDGKELPDWDGMTTVQFAGIETKDAGIYECFHEGRRGKSVHALIRVIVRSCPKDLYGDDCDNECPPCYNGGVCHDKWGVCVCPEGFAGPNCERACGENRFGANCNISCSPPRNTSNTDELCAQHLFCKPDPYGCSCAPGYKGSRCSEHCEPGRYGADCKQHCHCAYGLYNCNRITGACEGGCSRGFRGPSCQIEVELETLTPFVEALVDGEVELQVTAIKSLPLPVQWMHDGKELPDWDGMTTVQFGGVELKDAGTYECYYQGRRGKNVHAIMRVKITTCQSGHFGENCQSTCHCEGGHHNCDIDGYCSLDCEAGWTGSTCQEECTPGRFGPNCASTCHCHTSYPCDTITGVCSGDCEAGYMGTDCQTICPPNTYGVNCVNTCVCSNGSQCNRVDGSCTCHGRRRRKTCNETMQATDKLPPVTEEPPSACQCNVTSLWTYIHELRGAVTHHLNHLRQRQVEMEEAIRRIERRGDEHRGLEPLTLPSIPHMVTSTMDAADITMDTAEITLDTTKSSSRNVTTPDPNSHTDHAAHRKRGPNRK